MKKFILLCALTAANCIVYAQEIKTSNTNPYLIRKGDQLMLHNKGVEASVDAEVVARDGSRFHTDGSVTSAAGKKRMLRDGEIIPAKGVMITTMNRERMKVRIYR